MSDLYFTVITEANHSFEGAVKIIYGWRSAQHEELYERLPASGRGHIPGSCAPPSAEISIWRGSPVWESVASSVNQKRPFCMLTPVTEADEGATC